MSLASAVPRTRILEYDEPQALQPAAFQSCFCESHSDRHLILCPAFKSAPCSLLLHAAPLLEEKRDIGSQALLSNISDPFLHNGSCNWTSLATRNTQVEFKIRNMVS